MSNWRFVDGSKPDFPDLVINEVKKFELTGTNQAGDLKIYSCVNRSLGCGSLASVGTLEGHSDAQGWPLIVQHLFSHTDHSTFCDSRVPNNIEQRLQISIDQIQLKNLAL